MCLAYMFRLSAAQPEKMRKNCVHIPVLEFVLHVFLVQYWERAASGEGGKKRHQKSQWRKKLQSFAV